MPRSKRVFACPALHGALLCVLAVLSIQAVCSAQIAPAPFYSITEIPMPAGLSTADIHGMNARGDIVGTATFLSGRLGWRAFVGRAGSVTLIDDSYHSEAWAINVRGQIVGCYSQSDSNQQAALWLPGKPGQPYQRVWLGAGVARAINSQGQVAVNADRAYLSTPLKSASLRRNREPFIITNPDPMLLSQDVGGKVRIGSLDGMNDKGQVLFRFNSPATDGPPTFTGIWQQGKMRKVENKATHTLPRAINNAGQVVGMCSYAYRPDPQGGFVGTYFFHAFLDDRGSFRDLGALAGAADNQSEALAINNPGTIVGSSGVAFVYIKGKMIDLNTCVSPGSGWKLSQAQAINDRGQIAGIGKKDGRLAVFLLTPQP